MTHAGPPPTRQPPPPAGPDPVGAPPTHAAPEHEIDTRDRRRHRVVLALGLLGTLVIGVLLALQSRVNGEVAGVLTPRDGGDGAGWRGFGSDRVAAGVDAALLSFTVGWTVLVVAALVTPGGRRGLRALVASLRAGRLRWWQTVGGMAGAAFVVSQGIAVPVLGVAVFTVAGVTGLTVGGLLVDRVGLSPNGARPFTARRVLGCLVAVGGVTLSVSSSVSDGSGPASGVTLFLTVLLLALVVGAGTSAQQAVNGHVAQQAGSPWTAALVNFTAGMAVLVTARLLLVGTVPPATLPTQWWLYLSGPIGMTFIVLAALLVRTLGVLLLSLGNTAGQLVGSIALDELLPTPAGRPGVLELVAAGLIFAAVALAASRPRRTRAGAVAPAPLPPVRA